VTGHLIHVGYPKAGSTYLQRWFDRHPQLAYAEGGIAGFRHVYDIASQAAAPAPGIRWRVTSSEVLTAPRPDAAGPGAPDRKWHWDGEEQSRVCATLASLFPTATVLIVTRGFRSMILSSYSQFVRAGGSRSLAELAAQASAHGPWDYDSLIAAYRAAFGAGNVLLLPYELLQEDSARFLGEIEERLGLDAGPAAEERINAALSPVELAWYPRLARTARSLPLAGGAAHKLLARAAFNNRLRPAIRLLQRLRPREAVTADSIEPALVESFRGRADCLRDEPLYAPYADDYLL